MAVTRLGQIGIGVGAYSGFESKEVHEGLFTRLTLIGVGGSRYPGFQAKTAAAPQPEEEEFLGFPAISPAVIEGDGYGVLPDLIGAGQGVHGVVGRGRGRLRGLSGRGSGNVGVDGRGFVRLAAIQGTAEAVHGQQGNAVVHLKGVSGASIGSIGVQGSGIGNIVISIKGTAVGQQDDEDIAMIALLLAA